MLKAFCFENRILSVGLYGLCCDRNCESVSMKDGCVYNQLSYQVSADNLASNGTSKVDEKEPL